MLGSVDLENVAAATAQKGKKRKKYTSYSAEERYEIGMSGVQVGPAKTVCNFKSKFPNLNESTVRGFQKLFREQSAAAAARNQPFQKICVQQRGRPKLLGPLDESVQDYVKAQNNRGATITRNLVNCVANVLIARNHELYGHIDIDGSCYAQSLLRRMGYRRRVGASAKLEIPPGARREAELLYHYDIVQKVEDYNIPPELIIAFDQTPSKYVPVGRTTLAKKGQKDVPLKGMTDKRTITATFAVTFSGEFLPIQLIYGGKTKKSLPRFKFPASFSLSVNKTHYSNEKEAMKFLREIIVPYVEKVRMEKNMSSDQKALLIFDVFKGQVTEPVLSYIEDNNMVYSKVPNNMTGEFQVNDLTVNKYNKAYKKGKFNEWYSMQVTVIFKQTEHF